VALFLNKDVPTGIWVYQGGALPDRYDGTVFVTQWSAEGRSRIDVVTIEEIGGVVAGTVETFAAGFENVISVVADSRGRLYAADFTSHTVYVIE
jgi:hypothetical protein